MDWILVGTDGVTIFPVIIIVEKSGPKNQDVRPVTGRLPCYNKVPVKPLNHDCGAKCIDVHLSPTFLGWISKKRRKKRQGFIQEIGGAHQNHKVSKFTALQKDWEKNMRWLVSKMFQILTVFVMFIPIWGNDPVWWLRICFKWVGSTSN